MANDKTNSSPTILICTVGGNFAPILTAIRFYQPTFVWFVCTDGKSGSSHQIKGQGLSVKSNPSDRVPTLPNIPTQAGLSAEQFDVLVVPADDPDVIHDELRKLVERLKRESPAAKLIADYTGGTKSMTAALMLIGIEFDEQVTLSLVAGQRANLVQVTDGTETCLPANVSRIRFNLGFKVALFPWRHFGYEESVQSLESMRPPSHHDDREKYLRAIAASRGFAAWDRFDHEKALQVLKPLASQYGNYVKTLVSILDVNERQDPARLLDLWLNIERRGDRGQFDDAVARAYRLLEWTAQWLLKRDASINTSHVLPEQIPDGLNLPRNEQGRFFAGLRNAWQLLQTHAKNLDTSQFAQRAEKEMLSLLTIRNNSILAHGFQPVSHLEWNRWHQWMSQVFLPFLLNECSRSGIARMPPQLPTSFD